jgi:hypothetical protein
MIEQLKVWALEVVHFMKWACFLGSWRLGEKVYRRTDGEGAVNELSERIKYV